MKIGIAVLGLCVACAVPLAAQERNGLDVQKARTAHVQSRAKTVYYTHPWDLSGLPDYQPEQIVSGTIREWGSNYFADSNLNDYWEAAFHKFQPGVKFDVHMRTALEAAPALVTGVADLAACRLFTFSEEELYERAFNHEPLRILIATGSYDVPGWSPALAVVTNKDNPISHLTLQQLDGIFGAERSGGYQGTTWHPEAGRPASANIRTWGQLGTYRQVEECADPCVRTEPGVRHGARLPADCLSRRRQVDGVAARVCELFGRRRQVEDRSRSAHGGPLEGPVWHWIQRSDVSDAADQDAGAGGEAGRALMCR